MWSPRAHPVSLYSRKTPCPHCSVGPFSRLFSGGPLGKNTCRALPGTVWRLVVNGPPRVRPQQETGVVCRKMGSLNYGALNWSPRNMSTQLRDQLLSLRLAGKWKARGEKWWEKRSGATALGASRKMSKTGVQIPKWNWWQHNSYEEWWVILPKREAH